MEAHVQFDEFRKALCYVANPRTFPLKIREHKFEMFLEQTEKEFILAADIVIERPRLDTNFFRHLPQTGSFEAVQRNHRHRRAANQLFSSFPAKPGTTHPA